MPGRNDAGSGYRYGFNGMEKDDEVKGNNNSLDFGARIYDPRVGRWLSTDPLQKKFPSFTPYSFVNNMPIWAIDPDGRDIIVLSAANNVAGLGHAAVLIGNNKDGYRLYSDNGTTAGIGSSGASNDGPEVGVRFASINEFANSGSNFNEDGSVKYTSALRITTDKETDAKMAEAAATSIGEDYNVATNNCIDACSDALEAGDLDPGYSTSTYTNEEGEKRVGKGLSAIPNERYKEIVRNNEGTDISDEIVPDKKVREKRASEAKEKD